MKHPDKINTNVRKLYMYQYIPGITLNGKDIQINGISDISLIFIKKFKKQIKIENSNSINIEW